MVTGLKYENRMVFHARLIELFRKEGDFAQSPHHTRKDILCAGFTTGLLNISENNSPASTSTGAAKAAGRSPGSVR